MLVSGHKRRSKMGPVATPYPPLAVDFKVGRR